MRVIQALVAPHQVYNDLPSDRRFVPDGVLAAELFSPDRIATVSRVGWSVADSLSGAALSADHAFSCIGVEQHSRSGIGSSSM